jgi:hypothetical protein
MTTSLVEFLTIACFFLEVNGLIGFHSTALIICDDKKKKKQENISIFPIRSVRHTKKLQFWLSHVNELLIKLDCPIVDRQIREAVGLCSAA